jgi:hypothetical protein
MESSFPDQKQGQAKSRRSDSMVDSDDSLNTNVFNSLEFDRFITNKINSEAMSPGQSIDVFLSKDSDLPAFDGLFKSKDPLSSIFASKEWEMKYPRDISPKSRKPEDFTPKTFKSFANTTENICPTEEPEHPPSHVLKSGDWMPLNTLGNHVDVQYTPDLFSSRTSNTGSANGFELPLRGPSPVQTEWDRLYMSQLQRSMALMMPPPSHVVKEPLGQSLSLATAPAEDWPTSVPSVAFEGPFAPQPYYPPVPTVAPQNMLPSAETLRAVQVSEPVEPQGDDKKKRKRAPRKKVVPATKQYVQPTNLDVLMGRGGRSNHHPGNQRYREEVENLREWYRALDDKDEKTDLSQCLILYVNKYGGRFLEHDDQGWYVIDDVVARRKASQALREDNDPDKRAAKRRRFLEKRAREGEPSQPRKKARR